MSTYTSLLLAILAAAWWLGAGGVGYVTLILAHCFITNAWLDQWLRRRRELRRKQIYERISRVYRKPE